MDFKADLLTTLANSEGAMTVFEIAGATLLLTIAMVSFIMLVLTVRDEIVGRRRKRP